MAYLGLSRRALLDIQDIEAYSIEKWGRKVASEYLQSIEDALNLLREDPGLLKAKSNISQSLCFYRVRQHFLVCAAFKESIFVLTVKHGAMDLPSRIAEIEPQLNQEAHILYHAYLKNSQG
jgi:plasmid stabilization system protein ParE